MPLAEVLAAITELWHQPKLSVYGRWNYLATAGAAPGSDRLSFETPDPGIASWVRIYPIDKTELDFRGGFARMQLGSVILFQVAKDATRWMKCEVTGPAVLNAAPLYVQIPIEVTAQGVTTGWTQEVFTVFGVSA